MSVAADIRLLYRSLGGKRTLLYVLHRQLRQWSRHAVDLRIFDLIVQPVSPTSIVPSRLSRPWIVRMLRQDEAALMAQWAPIEELKSRFARGDIGVGLFRSQEEVGLFRSQEEIVGYLWLRLGEYDEPTIRCRFVPQPTDQVAWDYDLQIEERARGSMAFAVLWDAANELLSEKGYQWTASRISAFNPASYRAHLRLGAQRAGIVMFLCVGRWQLTVATQRRNLLWHVGLHSRPSVHVSAPSDCVGVGSINDRCRDSRSD